MGKQGEASNRYVAKFSPCPCLVRLVQDGNSWVAEAREERKVNDVADARLNLAWEVENEAR